MTGPMLIVSFLNVLMAMLMVNAGSYALATGNALLAVILAIRSTVP